MKKYIPMILGAFLIIFVTVGVTVHFNSNNMNDNTMMEGMRPEGMEGTRPEGMEGMEGMPPEGMEGMPPEGMEGMRPEGEEGMPPEGMERPGMGGMPIE